MYDPIYMKFSEWENVQKQRRSIVIAEEQEKRREGEKRRASTGTGSLFGEDDILQFIVIIVSQLCECTKDQCTVHFIFLIGVFPGGASGKEPSIQCGRFKRHSRDPWVGKIPWRRRKWQPTPVFLPAKSHGQRSWRATVHGVAKSWTRLKRLCLLTCIVALQCGISLCSTAKLIS